MKSIIEAIEDANLLRPFVAGRSGSLNSWRRWKAALELLYGLPTNQRGLVKQCTGRDLDSFTGGGFETGLFLTGRRSGKSRIAGVIATYEAALSGREENLDPGEIGVVAVVSPAKDQSQMVKAYIRAAFQSSLKLEQLILSETQEGFKLSTNVEIKVLVGDPRTIRGRTLLAAIVDECCFFGHEADAKVKSDTALIQSIEPMLMTTRGKLIGISSPYARRGWAYEQWEKHWGKSSATLVWNAPSRLMNPTLDQSYIDKKIEADPAAARAEYLGEWRDDIASFVPRATVEACVKRGRSQLPCMKGRRYAAFVDVSGGRSDDATLAIAHRDQLNIVIDAVRRWRPPFSPYMVIGQMARLLGEYGVKSVIGDNYAAEFVSQAFADLRIRYTKATKNKSQLYLELLPLLSSCQIELPDDKTLIDQLCSLERRTRSGSHEVIDHPKNQHDDVANAVAGVAVYFHTPTVKVGGF
jgi:hypothetical protein